MALIVCCVEFYFVFFKQKTAEELRISDWSSDVCASDLLLEVVDACIGVWCADRVGVHLSPRGDAHSMSDSNPQELFSYVARALGQRRIALIFTREALGEDSLTAQIDRKRVV